MSVASPESRSENDLSNVKTLVSRLEDVIANEIEVGRNFVTEVIFGNTNNIALLENAESIKKFASVPIGKMLVDNSLVVFLAVLLDWLNSAARITVTLSIVGIRASIAATIIVMIVLSLSKRVELLHLFGSVDILGLLLALHKFSFFIHGLLLHHNLFLDHLLNSFLLFFSLDVGVITIYVVHLSKSLALARLSTLLFELNLLYKLI